MKAWRPGLSQSFYYLNQWFKTKQGERLSLYIRDALACYLPDLKGDYLLQVGIEEHQDWLGSSKIEKKIISVPFPGKHKTSTIAPVRRLPFDTASIDVLFCPFTFSQVKYRYALMNEIDRVLSPHGYLLMCQVNPYSWWGLPWQSLKPLRTKGHLSAYSCRKEMMGRGYYVHDVKRFVYWPPSVNKVYWEKLFEKVGQMILPSPHGMYLMCAQKNTFQPLKNVTPMFYERGFSPW